MTNQYAPEHLIIETTNPEEEAARVVNAGSVIPRLVTRPKVPADYASGTNPTLPTNPAMPRPIAE